MEFLILGPIEVRDETGPVELGAAKERALLGVLALNANELVSTSGLVEAVWGERPPATAEKLVHGYVHALRKRLGADRIVTQGPGYRLAVGANDLDVQEFERLIAEARDAPVSDAVDLRRRALSLWRGRPLADVVVDGAAGVALARLEQLRLNTQLERVDGELGLGRHAALVGELESVAAAHPYDERAHALLMLALYRSGRQADALAVYQALRRRFDEELGLQPGQELRDLEAAILRQDGALALPVPDDGLVPPESADAEPPAEGTPVPSRRRPTTTVLVVAAASVVALVGAGVVAAAFRGDPAAVSVPPNSVGVIDPEQNRVVDSVDVGIRPRSVAARRTGPVWVANVADQTLARIASGPGRVERYKYVPLDATPTGLAVGFDAVWVAHGLRGQLSKVDPTLGRVTKTTDVTMTAFGTSTGSVAVGLGAVWVVYGDSTLARVDPRTVERTGATFAGVQPVGLAVGAGSVWVANGGDSTVERFNPRTFEEGPIRPPITVGNRPTAIAYGEGAVWVTNGGDDTVGRIDPNGDSVRFIAVGDEPAAVAVGAGAVWVANAGDGTVARIHPVTYDVETIDIGGEPAGIVVARGRVWVTVRQP
jgi:DNA-binding SARP family transcriptional activator/streptogramin lyase